MTHSGKHFMNQASTLVQDSIQGLEISNPDISVDIKHKGMTSLKPGCRSEPVQWCIVEIPAKIKLLLFAVEDQGMNRPILVCT
jgi:hypothetical protein